MRILQRGANASGFVRRCVNGKSRLGFFGEMVATVITCGEFQIHAGLIVLPVFIFDSKIGQRNLAVDDLEAVGLGDLLPGLFLLVRRKSLELCKVPVEVFFQFVVEDDAKILSSIAFDPLGSFLIDAVEGRIVPGFTLLDEALMKDLVFVYACSPVGLDKSLAVA